MTDANFPQPAAAPGLDSGGHSGWDKLLVGCGLGCGLLILAFGVFAVIAGLWATRPGTQHETTAVVSPEGVAVMKLRDIGEDAGTQQFLSNFLHTMNEVNRQVQRESLPESLRWLADVQGSNTSPAGFNMFFPKDMTVSIEPRDPAERAASEDADVGDELAFVAAVNFRSVVRPIRSFITWVVEQDAKTAVRKHGEHQLLPVGRNEWATFVDGTLVLSNSYAALTAALDRLDRGTIERAWSGEVPPGDWDFFGVVDQGTNAMQVVFHKIRDKNAELAAGRAVASRGPEALEVSVQPEVEGEPVSHPEPADDAVRLAFGIDIESADALSTELCYTLADAAAAVRYAAYLEEEMEQLRIRGEAEGLTVETTVLTDADRATARIAISGLEDKITQLAGWIVTLDDEVERRVREGSESAPAEGDR